MLTLTSLIQIPTNRDDLHVFRITGDVPSEDMSRLAEYMNDVFDQPGKVDLMLIFDRYDGASSGGAFDWETIKSRFRAVANIDKYVVVGAPDSAQDLINAMGTLIPVDAKTFDEENSAWRYLGAQAIAA